MNEWMAYRGLLKLAGVILAVPLVAWFLGFRQTCSMWMECAGQQEKLERLYAGQTAKDEGALRKRLTGPMLSNGAVLEQLSPVIKDNKVAMVKYTPFLTSEEGGLMLYTGELVLSGNFIPLLKVMREIEDHPSVGKIISSGFQVDRNRATGEKSLKMTLVIQQLTME